MTRSLLADACPECHPGDFPAVLPSSVTPDGNGSLRADYRHEACGTTWAAWWDAAAAHWPLNPPGALEVAA
jgi:hypothetical protein